MSCTLSTSHGGNARRIYQINILPRTDPVTAPDTGPKPPASLISNGHWTNCVSGEVDIISLAIDTETGEVTDLQITGL